MKQDVSPPEARLLRRTALVAGLQSALGVAITIAVLCFVALATVTRGQEFDEDATLTSAARWADDVNDPPTGVWLVIDRGGHREISPGLPRDGLDEATLTATEADGVPRTSQLVGPHREFRTLTQRRDEVTVQAVLDLRPAHVERSRLLDALLVTGGIGLVLAAVTGAWIGRRSMVPVARALSLQRRFVADAGHELRTPLTLISTRAQLLRRRAADTPFESEVDDLVADTGQLTAILEDLLIAADPRGSAPGESVDLVELAREVLTSAAPTAEERGVTLTLADDAEPAPVIGGDVVLRRAVTALLDNGIRHAASAVTITVRAAAKRVTLTVADDGPGIDPALMPNLFTRFSSGGTDAPAPDGRRRYGLGLALVSEIAARHGGEVSAHNADGGGAVLRLTLPRADRPERAFLRRGHVKW